MSSAKQGVTTMIHPEYAGGATEPAVGGTYDGRGAGTMQSWVQSIRGMFGDKLSVVPTQSVDLDAQHELAHTTTGLKYALRGRATVIEQLVGEKLASFQDPIKAVLPVTIVDSHRVVVTTKEVVGGRSIIAPERAPARTVGVKETSREVVLERFGGDLEMNLNLQHTPAAFKEELNLKIAAQQRELERVLIEIGYDTLLSHGTRLEAAILRSMPAYNGATHADGTFPAAMIQKAERIYVNNCFGVMNKSSFPMQSILAAAKHATAFSVGAAGSTLILPHGLPEMLRYTKPEAMQFKISGLKTTDNKPITMDLGTAHTDPATNIRMLTHIPMPTFEFGTATPRVGMGCLSQIVTVFSYYIMPGGDAANPMARAPGGGAGSVKIVDLENRCHKVVRSDTGDAGICIRKTRIVMSSAILAAPGSDTGELLVGMPHTGVSTSQTDETMKMQLRVYLGAVLKQPESVMILPDVMAEGIASTTKPGRIAQMAGQGAFEDWAENDDAQFDYMLSVDAAGNTFWNGEVITNESDEAHGEHGGINALDGANPQDVYASLPDSFRVGGGAAAIAGGGGDEYGSKHRVYRGAFEITMDGGGAPIKESQNCGHFGGMDSIADPMKAGGLDGQFAYRGDTVK